MADELDLTDVMATVVNPSRHPVGREGGELFQLVQVVVVPAFVDLLADYDDIVDVIQEAIRAALKGQVCIKYRLWVERGHEKAQLLKNAYVILS